jgi:hypothetical protein
MGKGSRTRLKMAEEKKNQEIEKQTQTKKKKRNKLIIGIIALALVVAIAVSACVYAFYFNNGNYLRNSVAASSTSTTIDGAMALYYFNQTYNSYKSYYGSYFSSLTGIDTTKSLKKQTYSSSTNETWFTNILSTTETAMTELLTLSDDAQANGFSLTDEEKDIIHNKVQAMTDAEVTTNGSVLTRNDVEKCLDLSYLATKYKNSLKAGYTVSDSDAETYYADNKKTYETCSYRSFSISYTSDSDAASSDSSSSSESSGSTSSTVTLMQEEAKVQAEKLKASSSEDDYLASVNEIEKIINPTISDDDLNTAINNTLTSSATYTSGNEVSEWAFDDSRAIGDTYIYDDSTNSKYTVYYLTSLAARDETATVDVRHILFTSTTYGSDDAANQKAQDVLNEWNSGDKTEDSFALLALKYTEDSGSMYTGGLYQNVKSGSMTTEFNDWIFDSSRKAGDTDIIQTSYGYHIMYYVCAGLPAWQADVTSAIQSSDYTTAYTSLKEQYPVTFNDSCMNSLTV